VYWIYFAFLLSYLLFFFYPIFLSSGIMQFHKYIPHGETIGCDLELMLSYCDSLFIHGETPYIRSNLYPPLAIVFFAPLLLLPFSFAYKIVSIITVTCYLLLGFTFLNTQRRNRQVLALWILILLTGLISYGLQFELERGQFNLIAIAFCFFGIHIYHKSNKHRFLAYLLFIFSVQLKVYPLIFLVLFVEDWHDWKNNIKRFLSLISVNLALLFALGLEIFGDFIAAIKSQTLMPYVWSGNHSILSFVSKTALLTAEKGISFVRSNETILQLVLLLVVASCIVLILIRTFRMGSRGPDSFLWVACSLGALLIPSVSHDYTLTVLTIPAALFLSKAVISLSAGALTKRSSLLSNGMLFIFSLAYSMTLFPGTHKPIFLKNNLPALILMLLIVTILSFKLKSSKTAFDH